MQDLRLRPRITVDHSLGVPRHRLVACASDLCDEMDICEDLGEHAREIGHLGEKFFAVHQQMQRRFTLRA